MKGWRYIRLIPYKYTRWGLQALPNKERNGNLIQSLKQNSTYIILCNIVLQLHGIVSLQIFFDIWTVGSCHLKIHLRRLVLSYKHSSLCIRWATSFKYCDLNCKYTICLTHFKQEVILNRGSIRCKSYQVLACHWNRFLRKVKGLSEGEEMHRDENIQDVNYN